VRSHTKREKGRREKDPQEKTKGEDERIFDTDGTGKSEGARKRRIRSARGRKHEKKDLLRVEGGERSVEEVTARK